MFVIYKIVQFYFFVWLDSVGLFSVFRFLLIISRFFFGAGPAAIARETQYTCEPRRKQMDSISIEVSFGRVLNRGGLCGGLCSIKRLWIACFFFSSPCTTYILLYVCDCLPLSNFEYLQGYRKKVFYFKLDSWKFWMCASFTPSHICIFFYLHFKWCFMKKKSFINFIYYVHHELLEWKNERQRVL